MVKSSSNCYRNHYKFFFSLAGNIIFVQVERGAPSKTRIDGCGAPPTGLRLAKALRVIAKLLVSLKEMVCVLDKPHRTVDELNLDTSRILT